MRITLKPVLQNYIVRCVVFLILLTFNALVGENISSLMYDSYIRYKLNCF